MGERALATPSKETEDVARLNFPSRGSHADSPAIHLLDALRTGDDLGVLAVCGDTTTVSADNMRWSCRGREEIHDMLTDVRRRFPGITFESRTRHVGFGLVIDEARVQDVMPDEAQEEPVGHLDPGDVAERDLDQHPMWDEPVNGQGKALVLWPRTTPDHLGPTPLNMPVRVTVRHDDLQVHEVSLSFPAALLKRALGIDVDPLEMSLSEVQSAFIAPMGAGFTTYALAGPDLAAAPPPAAPEKAAAAGEPPRRRRRRLGPVLVALVAVAAAGAWWAVQGEGRVVAGAPTMSPSQQPSQQPSLQSSPQPSASASASASTRSSSSKAPTVTHAKPSSAPSRKPNITLRSDLAFGFNSADLSDEAKAAIDKVARQVRGAGLSGKIYVDGYTDDLGAAAYGMELSRRRADAVSTYLGSQLVGVPVTIVSIAHGEQDPVADNSTQAGRQANRRVTITLPKP
jgi:outer membrane protein OmpA-like peptidoglycan-associated protein